MLPINNYGGSAVKKRQNGPVAGLAKTGMDTMDTVEALKLEKTLLTELITFLEQEIEYVISGEVDTLEDSMPQKMRILEAIAANRNGFAQTSNDDKQGYSALASDLKQELNVLWKRAGGLNETSKELVSRRLADIESRLEPFFAGLQKGYDRSGKASKSVAHTIKSGV